MVKVYVSLPTEIHDNREKVRGRQITGLDKLVKKGVHVVVSFGLVDVEDCIDISGYQLKGHIEILKFSIQSIPP